jgi:hypothetical protein
MAPLIRLTVVLAVLCQRMSRLTTTGSRTPTPSSNPTRSTPAPLIPRASPHLACAVLSPTPAHQGNPVLSAAQIVAVAASANY